MVEITVLNKSNSCKLKSNINAILMVEITALNPILENQTSI
jgi:hypothetical protein